MGFNFWGFGNQAPVVPRGVQVKDPDMAYKQPFQNCRMWMKDRLTNNLEHRQRAQLGTAAYNGMPPNQNFINGTWTNPMQVADLDFGQFDHWLFRSFGFYSIAQEI